MQQEMSSSALNWGSLQHPFRSPT